jgi:prepilin-type N-terminal cleavage/methylation domain-containing protein/prepilin-type processing-associated H-X9-DG protein
MSSDKIVVRASVSSPPILNPMGRRICGFTLIELVVTMAILVVLLGLLLPAVNGARQAARRIHCSNNAKQVALGLQSFESAFKRLPVGTCTIPSATPLRGWFTHVLPYLEQVQISDQIERSYQSDRNPFDPVSHPLFQQKIAAFMCAEDGRLHEINIASVSGYVVGLTSFQGNLGVDWKTTNGVLFGDSRVRFADVSDGLSNTYAFGERPPSAKFDFGWWYAGFGADGTGAIDHTLGAREIATHPYNVVCERVQEFFHQGEIDNECSARHFWSLHRGGGHFAFLDGSVRFLSYESDSILPALATRAAAEIIANE